MERFVELRCIGRGSYGSAHLVRERSGQQRCFVVKKIPMELLTARERDQSFREVELLAKLHHPNVVEYKESFVVDNVIHIVMAYCDGGDLAGRIGDQQRVREKLVGAEAQTPTPRQISDARGYFPIAQVLDWFVQMAMAIKYLHAQRVLHRDLKTSNIFLTTENVVKLGDFGIAKTLDSTLDQARTMVGTPYYMSPEVCESKPYSYASDVWSLGCVLYEMLALRHAFDAPNILTLIFKIVKQDCAPVPPHYDKEVSQLLHSLLDKDPARRPSMEDIFAIPYIRNHMQGLMASGGSLRMNPVVRRPSGGANAAGRRRVHPKNAAARRASVDRRRFRLTGPASGPSSAASVASMQWLPLSSHSDEDDCDDADIQNELALLNASILEESQLHFRLPERSTTPEPLVVSPDGKPSADQSGRELGHAQEVEEDASLSLLPRIASGRCRSALAWAHSKRESSEVDDTDDVESLRFQAEAEELMDPNFQNEYSEECMDSVQFYYGSDKDKTDGDSECSSSTRAVRRPESSRSCVIHHFERAQTAPERPTARWQSHRTPLVKSSTTVREPDDALELSSLSLDGDGSEVPAALNESAMLRELELEVDSDYSDASVDTSLSEGEAEENFYSDNSSDFFDQSGTQYSDDFDDLDAEIIEYADDEFVSEAEDDADRRKRGANTDKESATPLTNAPRTPSPVLRGATGREAAAVAHKLAAPTEVQWVMRNVAQSLLLSRDELHSHQAA